MKRVRFSSMGPPESDLVSQDCEQPCLTSLLLSPPTQPTQVCVCLAVHLSVNCQFIILSLPVIKVMLKRHKALLSPWKLSFLLFKETSSNDYRVFKLLGRSHGCLLI